MRYLRVYITIVVCNVTFGVWCTILGWEARKDLWPLSGPPRDFVGPGKKYRLGALDDVIYKPRPWGPRPPFGAPTLWNAVSLHFEDSNQCSNPTAVRYVTVSNLRYVKNVKLKHFRGPLSSRGAGASCPPGPLLGGPGPYEDKVREHKLLLKTRR